jgi:hypothetical protein
MSSAKNFDLSALIPGFDAFKQMAGQIPGVGKGLGAGVQNPFMPKPGSWIAPTLSVEELEKRITELQTVKLWLENNARLIEVTTQALQVQKMTLSTLQDMKVQMGKAWPGMASASNANTSASTSASTGKSSPKAQTSRSRSRNKTQFDMGQSKDAQPAAASAEAAHAERAERASQAAPAEPGDTQAAMQIAGQQAMQMWQGLTQQFGQIASQVMQDGQAAAQKMAQAAPVAKRAAAKKSPAKAATKTAPKTPAKAAARTASSSARKTASKASAKAASTRSGTAGRK